MALTSGTKLGPYEILSPLGAGGMGEVYRARDTRLDRSVAVKILPSHLSEDAEAKQRFDREARTISSLNHPNICTLHDVGHQDGVDYLVMEYLEGQTLADRLAKGPLPIEQVLRYGDRDMRRSGEGASQRRGASRFEARQHHADQDRSQADGLRSGQGVGCECGRGIRPDSNSELRLQEAIPLPRRARWSERSSTCRRSRSRARKPMRVRTFSPWARCCTRWSPASGPLRARRAATAMAAVLEREPAPISSMQPMTPPALERLIKTCLAKDPDERWQTAHDVKLQLKQIAEGGSQASAPAMTVAPPRKRRNMLAWGVAAVLGGDCQHAALFLLYQANQKQLPVLRVEINPPDKMQFNLSGDHGGPAMISPDGRYIVFSAYGAGGAQLYLRSLDSTSSQALPGTEGAMFPFWSPDSRSIAFFTDDKLKRIEVSGGTPVTICGSTLGRGGSWNQDGTIVAALSYNTGISRVPASGGTPTARHHGRRRPSIPLIAGPGSCLTASTSSISPLNTMRRPARIPRCSWLRWMAKKTAFCCTRLSNAIYASGRLLYQRENSLVAQPFDPSNGKFSGEPQTLSENVQFDAGLWRMNVSASTDGMMLYASGTASGTEILTWYDRSGKRLGTVGEQGEFYDLDLSPDEKKVVTTELNTATATIWVHDLSNNLKTRLTFSGGAHLTPLWSPDGKEVAFTSNQQTAISVKTLGSSAPERTLLSSPNPIYQAISDWSHDGRYLMYEQGTGMSTDLWVLPLSGDSKPFPYTSGDPQEERFRRTAVGWRMWPRKAGRPEVFVAPFPGQARSGKFRTEAALGRAGAPTARSCFTSISTALPRLRWTARVPHFRSAAASCCSAFLCEASSPASILPTHDGQRFIAVTPSEGSSQSLTLVQNWPAELKNK